MLTLIAFTAGVFASVFALTGATKVRQPVDAALAMRQFGVVDRIRPGYGRLLGVAELTLAGLFIGFPTSVAPFAGAAVLLAVFLSLIVRSLRLGDRFPCACFGKSDDTLSVQTAVRAGALLILAVVGGLAARLADIGGLSARTRLDGIAAGALLLCSGALLTTLASTRPFSSRVGSDA